MIEEFLSYLRLERNRSPLTVEAYGRDLRRFEKWVSDEFAETHISEVTQAEVRAWLASEAESGNGARSLRRKAQSLRSFFRWGVETGKCTANPMNLVSLAKAPKPLPAFVAEEDIEKIKETPQAEDPLLNFRNQLIIDLLYTCGLRQAELLGLSDRDVDFSREELKVHGKGGKQRVVPLLPEVCAHIREWIAMRDGASSGTARSVTLFPGRDGSRMSRSRLYQIVENALLHSKSSRRSPHTLRHSFATSMLSGGADIMTVKEMLGHSSLASTQIYTHLDFRQLRQDYAKAHPRGQQADHVVEKDWQGASRDDKKKMEQ